MAYKPSPNSLIHCNQCGEDYSATYKRCPFCGAKNSPQQPAPDRQAPPADLDDTYVFDGQDLFDDEAEEDYAPSRSKGGKRLADRPLSNPFANLDVNWPRMITFVCSLIIIVAAMVIVFTVVYPQLRDPTADSSQSPSSAVTDPAGDNSQGVEPSADVSGTASTDPGTEPSAGASPAVPGGLTAISFNRANDADFTLQPGESHTITLNFTPANWSGDITWSSTDTRYATVDANGKVTNVNTTNQLRFVTITATAGGISLESKVYCRGVTASEPTASVSPSTQPSSGPGGVTVGKKGTIVNATGGLNVRSGPGVTYDRIGSLWNGTTVDILEDAGNGWYKISFTSTSGGTTQGYVMGDFISTN